MSKLTLIVILNLLLISNANALFPKQKVCELYSVYKDRGINKDALKMAFYYFYYNQNKFDKRDIISIADYSLRSSEKRFFILSTRSPSIKKYKVSHGSGNIRGHKYGDPEHDGWLNSCRVSRKIAQKYGVHTQQNMTRAGFFKTAELYYSRSHPEKWRNGVLVNGWPNLSYSPNRNGLRLDGLNPGINDRSRRQGVVMHGAWYNYRDIMGRSYGCPAFEPKQAIEALNILKNGSMFYSHTPQCESDYEKIRSELIGLDTFCELF